jgi:hypothetical protein
VEVEVEVRFFLSSPVGVAVEVSLGARTDFAALAQQLRACQWLVGLLHCLHRRLGAAAVHHNQREEAIERITVSGQSKEQSYKGCIIEETEIISHPSMNVIGPSINA